jgi:hypothetical protein
MQRDAARREVCLERSTWMQHRDFNPKPEVTQRRDYSKKMAFRPADIEGANYDQDRDRCRRRRDRGQEPRTKLDACPDGPLQPQAGGAIGPIALIEQ